MWAVITVDEKIVGRDFRTKPEAYNFKNKLIFQTKVISQDSKRFAIIEMKNKPNK